MKCIIVDDDQLSRNVLEQFIAKTGDIEIAGSFSDPVTALKYMNENEVELIFLDVEMPEMTGLEFITSLSGQTPEVILTTSHEKFITSEIDITKSRSAKNEYPLYVKGY